MSSTKRGGKRHISDYYVTPAQDINQFLNAFISIESIDNPNDMFWFDPCAGGDEFQGMAYVDVIKEKINPAIISMDIREDSRADIKSDYLSTNYKKPCADIIATNPPFNVASDFLKMAFTHVRDGGYIAFLLRLNFFGSDNRKELFKEFGMPKHTFIHPDRISFTLDGKADSIEYAHFVWQVGRKFSKTNGHLLQGHSKTERLKYREDKRQLYNKVCVVTVGRAIRGFGDSYLLRDKAATP